MKVLVVEDSKVVGTYICGVLEQSDFEIIGPIDNGLEAVEQAVEQRPDIILMDIHLPGINGIKAIEQIMARRACPIVVLSGKLKVNETDLALEALRAGAVEVLAKPEGMTVTHQQQFKETLTRTLRLMSKIKVVHRWRKTSVPSENASNVEPTTSHAHEAFTLNLLAIGASTGGPSLLFSILSKLPAPFPIPILISQHIASGFEGRLCDWLNTSGHQVVLAQEGDCIKKEKVYLSTAGGHMVLKNASQIHIADKGMARFVPSIDLLFSSIANFHPRGACAVLLTGMGNDGTQGMTELKKRNGINIAQEPKSCVVPSMPQQAIAAQAIDQVMTVPEIINFLKLSHKFAWNY